MSDSDAKRLHAAITALAGAGTRSRLHRVETVVLLEDGAIAWDGEVTVYALEGHPRARLGYAWIAADGAVYALLGEPGIDSATSAVLHRRP